MPALKKKQDNTIEIVQKTIKEYAIPVTKSSVAKYLKSHPDYPSLKSVTDAFSEWKVENYAVELNQEELLELDKPFIAHVVENGQQQILLIHSIAKEKVIYSDTLMNSKAIPFDDFYTKWSKIVILINPDEKSGEENYKRKSQNRLIEKSLLPLLVSPFLIYIVYNWIVLFPQSVPGINFTIASVACLSLIGFILSIVLMMIEAGNNSSAINKICQIGKKGNCNTILDSEAAYIWGWISWADAGLIYFASILLLLITSVPIVSILGAFAWISLLTLPYCAFSIYYQAVKEKNWCPLCLATVTTLLVNFVLLAPYLLYPISLNAIFYTLLCFASTTAVWLLYKAYLRERQKADELTISSLKIKRNPEVFKYLLTRSTSTAIESTENSLLAGNPQASITITAFLSLNCTPCVKAFNKLADLLSKSNDFKVNFVLSEHGLKNALDKLHYVNTEKGSDHFLNMLKHWYTAPDKSTDLFSLPSDYTAASDFSQIHRELFIKHRIQHTPTIIIQGYPLPKSYGIEDLFYFIDTLKQVPTYVDL